MRAYRGQTSMDQMIRAQSVGTQSIGTQSSRTQSAQKVYRTRAAKAYQITPLAQAATDQLSEVQYGIKTIMLIAAVIVSPLIIALALSLPQVEPLIGNLVEYGLKISSDSDPSAIAGESDSATKIESTPRGQWQKGHMPYLYQTDLEWANIPYGGGTIETHGCGPTCLSMVYIKLTGKTDLDPVKMAEFATSAGYIDAEVTSWLFMSEGAAQIGLKAKELPASASIVMDELAAGRPVICIVGKGDFTTDGHFIVLSDVSADGRVNVHDPNSVARSNVSWDLERVLAQCRNIWSYSA